MSIDLKILSLKIKNYREQLLQTIEELSNLSGINIDRLNDIEKGIIEPTGDEILIIADIFKCDYYYFISNERETLFDQTEILYRKFGSEISKNDRWAIQEVLFLAECENKLEKILGKTPTIDFHYVPQGNYKKGQGIDAAKKLRDTLNFKANEFNLDIFNDFRKLGLLIYRRKLENSTISGICISHKTIGNCLLINYEEDIYRQRFSVAHEVAHSIFDNKTDEPCINFSKWDEGDLKEIRANAFAATYLVPEEYLITIPDNRFWDNEKLIHYANKLRVNTMTLLIALKNNNYVDQNTYNKLKNVRIPLDIKNDPELVGLSGLSFNRKLLLLEKGLTQSYVRKCHNAFVQKKITLRKMAEMLLVDESELFEINELFKLGIQYEN